MRQIISYKLVEQELGTVYRESMLIDIPAVVMFCDAYHT